MVKKEEAPQFPLFVSKHDRIIGALGRPSWVVEGSLMGKMVKICTDNNKTRKGTVTIYFDTQIAPGIRSSDLEDDYITAKMILFCGISGSDPRYQSANAISIMVRNYFAMVRWRYGKDPLIKNSDLTADWLKLFLKDVEARGIIGLPPYEERIEELRSRVISGDYVILGRRKGNVEEARINLLAEALGASNAMSLPKSILRALDEIAELKGFSLPSREIYRQSHESEEESEDSSEEAGDASLSETRLISFFTVLQLLFYFREHLSHDPIPSEPFSGEDGVAKAAKAIAKVAGQRSLTVPAYQGCFLVDRAITWITTYYPEIKDFTENVNRDIERHRAAGHWRPHEAALSERVKKDRKKYTAGEGSWWLIQPTYNTPKGWIENIRGNRPGLRTVLFEFLATAALVVIAAFSARRYEELDSLRDDCVKIEDGELWLQTWISKNIRDLDLIPIPPTVAQAVEVLKWLSEGGRRASGEPWLFAFAEMVQVSDGPSPKKPNYDVYSCLARFAAHINVPMINGQPWEPKPTQFRRFFGMVYFHRFDFPSLIALSNFYRHFNPTRTRGYIEEIAHGTTVRRREENAERNSRAQRRIEGYARDRLNDLHKAGLDYRISLIAAVVKGEGYLAGNGGNALMADVGKAMAAYKSRIGLVREEELDGKQMNACLREISTHLRIEPHPEGHSGCKCTAKPADLKAANCLKERAKVRPDAPRMSGPDIEFATPERCTDCVHNCQMASTKPYWLSTMKEQKHQAEHALDPFFRAMASGRAEHAQSVLDRWHSPRQQR